MPWPPSNLTDGVSYTVRSRATDTATNVETPGSGITFTYDTTAPNVAIGFPADGSFRNSVPNAQGTSSDATSGVSGVIVKVRKHGDANGYWNGSSFTANVGGAATFVASGTTFWSATISGVTFVDAQSYDVIAIATDNATNTATASNQFTFDSTSPTASITFPSNGGVYNSTSWNSGCSTPSTGDLCGTAADSGSGVHDVFVSIKRNSDNMYLGRRGLHHSLRGLRRCDRHHDVERPARRKRLERRSELHGSRKASGRSGQPVDGRQCDLHLRRDRAERHDQPGHWPGRSNTHQSDPFHRGLQRACDRLHRVRTFRSWAAPPAGRSLPLSRRSRRTTARRTTSRSPA